VPVADHVDVDGASIEELEELYRRRYGRFLRVCTATIGSPEGAHDAVQEGFALALRHRAAYRRDGPLEAWVWRAVVHAARKHRATAARVSPRSSDATTNGAAPDEIGVRAWVAALPERQRLVVFLRYFADLDYRSIAEALEIEVGTVSATLSSAHAALRRRLEDASEEVQR
jgi:RNA polymerase sigma-70 factor (ECF subfamily)